MTKTKKLKNDDCKICGFAIKLSKSHTLYKCLLCDEFVHKDCATEGNLIQPNGHYYCEIHSKQAPKNRRRIPSQLKDTICDICDLYILENRQKIICSGCKSAFHIDCLPANQKTSLNPKQWICSKCEKDGHTSNAYTPKTSYVLEIPEQSPYPQPNWNDPEMVRGFIRYRDYVMKNPEKTINTNPSDNSSTPQKSTYQPQNEQNNPNIRETNEYKLKMEAEILREVITGSLNCAIQNSSKLTEIQLKEANKQANRKLPLVNKVGVEWKIFYKNFLDTKDFFSPVENINRVREAIKCEEILNIGGFHIFLPETFENALLEINKRVGRPERILLDEKEKIVNLNKLTNNDTKGIISFIGIIRNYAHLVESLGCEADKYDTIIIARISRLLPDKLRGKWLQEYELIKNRERIPSIRDLSMWLDSQTNSLETSLLFDKMDPFGEVKIKSSKIQKEKSIKNIDKKINALNIHQTHSESGDEISDDDDNNETLNTTDTKKFSPLNYCWYHENYDHSSLICYTLKAKSGKEVTELARKKGICTYCGWKAHSPCQNKGKLLCPLPNCDLNHEVIFCFKRKFKQQNDNKNKKLDGSQKSNEKSHAIIQDETVETMNEDLDVNNVNIVSGSQTYNFLSMPSHNDLINYPNWTIYEIENSNILKMEERNNSLKELTSPNLLSVVVVHLCDKNLIGALLLDSGSSVSLLDENVANVLKLTGPTKPISLSWSGGKSRQDETSRIVKTNVCGIQNNAKSYKIYFRTIKDLGMPQQKFNAKEMKQKFPYLNNLPLLSYSRIIGVIGNDQKEFFKQENWIEPNETKNERKGPSAFSTPLGYCVIGSSFPLSEAYEKLCVENQHFHNIMSKEEEKELVKMQESVMGLDYKKPYENDRQIAEEKLALEILNEKVRKSEDGLHYEAPLLWRESKVKLPTEESLTLANKRLNIMLKHANKIGKTNQIKDQINNLLAKNYARELKPDEIKNYSSKTFYIPLFITESATKRLRLIWDAAAKVNGMSLNDYLLPGPNLYNNLQTMLFKMREGKYLVKGDIGEMFHQVFIIKEDRQALRFIWKNEINEKPKHFEMNVMIFGAVCSPTTSQFVKNKIALEFKNEFPEAANAIINDTYVDDFLKSFNDLEFGKKLIKNARDILKTGGFNLVKLKGNDGKILQLVEENLSDEEKKNEKLFSKESREKILGYIIDFNDDTISLALILSKVQNEILNATKIPTKKEVLKLLMSFHDPSGFFQFFTSKMKLIYHHLCKEKIDWDDVISQNDYNDWCKCMKWLNDVSKIKIPRCYSSKINDTKFKQLWLFCDAGKEILCCVAFVRSLNKNFEPIDSRMIGSKSYIVPLKQKRTIPELELDVAAKAVLFAKVIKESHSITFNQTFFLTDNACVFCWITNGANKATIYVQNRLNKIKHLSEKHQWCWISTEYQTADYGTKFEAMPALCYENEWFNPKLFSLPEDSWPDFKVPKTPPENTFQLITDQNPENINDAIILNLNKYSSWDRVIKIIQCIHKFVLKLRIKIINKRLKKHDSKELQAQKIKYQEDISKKDYMKELSEIQIIRLAQRFSMNDEISQIRKSGTLNKSNKLYKFNPFLDENDVLRISTRLSSVNSNFNKDKISPIILPKKQRITELIILKYHENNMHSHYKTVVTNLLQRFFIANAMWEVKKTVRKLCYRCKRWNAKPDEPMMGDLPSYRLASYLPPFSYAITDICGPFPVRVKRSTEKRWLFVYSCLTTRAIHIEIINGLDSESCLMALQNTINLRGAPKRIISDNGTNFVGGSKILNAMQNEWNKKLYEKGVITQNIEWEFSMAKASSMNGSVERMIGLIKSVFKKMQDTLNSKIITPNDFVFRCLICEIIGMLNNRPLTMIPIEGNENSFLTPNHFLMLRSNFQSAPSNDRFLSCNLKNWTSIKEMINVLWNHWHKAYVNEILHREKWINYKKPVEIGDLVMTADPTINNLWRLGKIVKVIPGSKDQVRKVTIRIGRRNKIDTKILNDSKQLMKWYKNDGFIDITRPVTQIAPLNLKANI